MPLEIYKRGRVYWAKGWVEYNGRRIAGPYPNEQPDVSAAYLRDACAWESRHGAE